jgi:8-oxo-dGTP pyrophosphatase MutT (NUDIX family)
MGDSDAPPALPAATVTVLRDGDEGLEVLMVKRSGHGAFAGHWVFPGGKVDAADRHDAPDELTAARRAAVREAAEEAGMTLDAEAFVAFAHWMPPPAEMKRFSTWFFAATAESHEVAIDGHEIHDHVWVRPADALARRAVGEIQLAPPTFMTLHQLAVQPDAESFLAWARAMAEPPRYHTHWAEGPGGVRLLLWEGDAGYHSGDVHAEGRRNRLYMHPEPDWVVEQD